MIPIVHINGFKISERTIYGCMDDKELLALFTGCGYQPLLVEHLADIDEDLAASLDWAVDEIRKIQKAARSGNPISKPRWPVLLMRSPKVVTMTDCPPDWVVADVNRRARRARRKYTVNRSKAASGHIRSLSRPPSPIPRSCGRSRSGCPATARKSSSGTMDRSSRPP